MPIIVPRKPQALAIAKAVPALRRHKRALVVLATAIGKTITSALIAQKLKSRRVLFLVHNNFILDNSLTEYKKVFGESRTYALYNGLFKDGAFDADFVFASLQTMGEHLSDWRRKHFDLIVVDEAHHSQAETYLPVIQYFIGMKLGITATPDRMDLLDIRKIFGEEVINITLEEAIAKGWLPPIEYHVVTDDGFDEEVLARISQEVLKENRRISMDELNRRVFVRARDKKVASIIEGYDERTIIFCRNVAHAEHFRPFLKLSATFHSRTGGGSKQTWQKNQKVLEDLRSGLLRRMLTVNACNEGVDIPSIGLLVFLRTTESDTIWHQQLGRGCRPGKQKLVVLDFVGNVQRIMMLKGIADTIARYHEESTTAEERAGEGYGHDLFHLSGKGFEFTFSDKIVDLMKILERVQVDLYPTWQEASIAANVLKLKSSKQYYRGYKKDIRLPSTPPDFYHDFPGWSTFFARSGKYETWQEASAATIRLGITSGTEYVVGRKHDADPRLPHDPYYWYEDFPGWEVFLIGKKLKKTKKHESRQTSKKYKTWQEAGAAAQRLGIRSYQEYLERYKEDVKLPPVPSRAYRKFPGILSFLGL